MAKFLSAKLSDKNVLELALERIRYTYDLFDHIAVSFSGGKDSTVVLNLCLQVARERNRLPLHVMHFDEEAIPYEVEHYVRRVAARPDINLDWFCVPIKHTNACSSESTDWITWNPEEKHLWVRPMPPEAKTKIDWYDPSLEVLGIPEISPLVYPPDIYGTVGVMLGIRADESLSRRRAVSAREHENYIVKHTTGSSFGSAKLTFGNVHKIMPIYDWRTADVWTAPAQFGWDYCAAYDLMEMAGIAHEEQRVAPPYGTQPMKGLHQFRVCFPDVWEKISRRVPGANTAAMYANTELYAAGRAIKPDGVSWHDYVLQLLSEVPDAELRGHLASTIRKYIKLHHERTHNAPIAPYAYHPDSGVCWDLLARIVIRRDNKNRMLPSFQYTSKATDPVKHARELQKYQEDYARYAAELAGLSEGGTRY